MPRFTLMLFLSIAMFCAGCEAGDGPFDLFGGGDTNTDANIDVNTDGNDAIEDPGCVTSLDCAANEVCESGLCVVVETVECVDSSDCDEGQRCEMGSCVPQLTVPACVEDSDCDDGDFCLDNGFCGNESANPLIETPPIGGFCAAAGVLSDDNNDYTLISFTGAMLLSAGIAKDDTVTYKLYSGYVAP